MTQESEDGDALHHRKMLTDAAAWTGDKRHVAVGGGFSLKALRVKRIWILPKIRVPMSDVGNDEDRRVGGNIVTGDVEILFCPAGYRGDWGM